MVCYNNSQCISGFVSGCVPGKYSCINLNNQLVGNSKHETKGVYMDIYEKLKELDIELPTLPAPMGIYKPVKQAGNLLYVSGQGPVIDGVPVVCGKVDSERTIEEGQYAARLCALNALSILHNFLGDLNKVKSVVKVLGFVASAPGFNGQPEVVNGASRLLADVFGEENGIGARSAIGTNELPSGISVEIEFIFEI